MKRAIIKDIQTLFDFNHEEYQTELESLKRIRMHDEYTYFHSLNVARLSVMLGERLNFKTDHLLDLGWAALLHDLGKVHVPLKILNKAQKFESQELAIMQSHPLNSLVAMSETGRLGVTQLRRLSAAFEHHQRYDLNGYPSVDCKLNLHPYSRIIAIADCFDAMTTDRIYQRRVPPDVALKIMAQGFGTIFDPVVLQAFITCMGAYPVGSLVRLSNDRLAIVKQYDEEAEMDRPEIRLVENAQIRDINLMSSQNRHLFIIRSELPEDHDIDPFTILNEEYSYEGAMS